MASQDLPYRSEYAKSGRASCKACKGLISKDTLRMAQMVQSHHFDGKVPNWYHFSCFFKKFRVKSTSDVAHFDSLRWDDQKKIEGHCSSTSSGGGGKATTVQTLADLLVEYSKSSRAMCRGCDEKIEMAEVRIAKMVEPDVEEYGHVAAAVGLIPRWHHVDCFVQAMSHLGVSNITANNLTGFGKLKKPDREMLAQKLGGSITTKKTSGKRSAACEETATASATKKSKLDSEDEKKLKEQNDLVWKIRDSLSRSLKTTELRNLLEENAQVVPSGESKILDRCSDGMAFGALEPCPECQGQLAFIGHCYCCTGNLTAWTKCTYWTRSPDRRAWQIPGYMKEDHPYLNSFKFKARARYFSPNQLPPASTSQDITDGSPCSSSSEIDGGHTKATGSALPLTSLNFLVLGKFEITKKKIKDYIVELGGTVAPTISYKVGLCVIPDGDDSLDNLSEKIRTHLEEKQIPVISENFVHKVKEKSKLVPVLDFLVSSWGQSKVKSIDKFGGMPKEEKSSKKSKSKSSKSLGPEGSRIKKFAVKGGAVVDPGSGLSHSHHVYETGGVVYNAVLGMVDIQRGSNSYYKLQILESDGKNHYSLFRSWGRVGTSIGGTKIEDFGRNCSEAIDMFEELYESKTGNIWGNVKNFVKYPNKFYPLEIDYGQGDEEITDKMATAGSSSTLPAEVQSLIKMIFDVDRMKNVLLEFEIDVNKMPLGKLSKKQIESAYKVLTEALTEIQGDKNSTKLLDASNRFYTLIPHDFGFQTPPLLDDEEFIKAKTQMLDNLLEIEVAYNMLRDEANEGKTKNPIDANYEKLNTDIEVLVKDSEEFKMLEEYVANTHAPTHSSYSLELMDVFKIERHGEGKRYKPFKKLPNRKLLWHGSRTTNYAGILSQGLRIAPPEAPVTGYMFGKGVYFADMASKSANYCFTSRSKNVGLVLLCEVALGNMVEKTHAENVTKLPQGKHSVKGLGSTQPDPAGTRMLDGGVEVPMGIHSASGVDGTSLLYNEYIVYDVAQINMKYLLKLKFHYK